MYCTALLVKVKIQKTLNVVTVVERTRELRRACQLSSNQSLHWRTRFILANMDTVSTEVIIHPLVLLSVTDHYNRVAKDTRKRVVGVLLGSRTKNRVDITNSFAVPFEEDLSNPTVWFLDHNFLESMFWMFKKVNSKYEGAHPSHLI